MDHFLKKDLYDKVPAWLNHENENLIHVLISAQNIHHDIFPLSSAAHLHDYNHYAILSQKKLYRN